MQEAEAKVNALNISMTTKYCPLVSGDCRKTCGHFSSAYAYKIDCVDYHDYFVVINPRCKLWGTND